MPQTLRWQVFPDAAALTAHAANTIRDAAHTAITARGEFHIVLAGGHTPKLVYEQLCNTDTAWELWQIYFGDERCLPLDNPGRNDTLARCVWIERVHIPQGNVHSIPAERGPESAATEYSETVRAVYQFDFVLLGLGEDGHTASLFPGNPLGKRKYDPSVLAVQDAPKLPAARVSLSAARLSRARQVLFLVSGESKRAAVNAWRTGADIPARHITPAAGVDVLVDRAAWPET